VEDPDENQGTKEVSVEAKEILKTQAARRTKKPGARGQKESRNRQMEKLKSWSKNNKNHCGKGRRQKP